MESNRRTQPRIKVYSGLTLDAKAIRRLLPAAHFAPPARKGDLLGDMKKRYNVVAIIDGVFHQSPAVSCGEIMDALRSGLRIYGSSSMGALRASELDRYGMIGHGKIYEYIKSEPFFRDDYLGQVYHAVPGPFRLNSVPYIDFHFSLLRLLASHRMSRGEFDLLTSVYRDLHYTERNLESLLAVLGTKGPKTRLQALARKALAMESQKKIDALGLLRRIDSDLRKIRNLNERLRLRTSLRTSSLNLETHEPGSRPGPHARDNNRSP
jgi:hypothetical protein